MDNASINVKPEGGGTLGICGEFAFSQEFLVKSDQFSISSDTCGLETVVSVLFSNTHTRLLYNEREIFNTSLRAVLKISRSLYSKQVRVFVNKTRTNSL